MKKWRVIIAGCLLFVLVVGSVVMEENGALVFQMASRFICEHEVKEANAKEIIHMAGVSLEDNCASEVITGGAVEVTTGPAVQPTLEPVEFTAKFEKKQVKLYPKESTKNPLVIPAGQKYDEISWSVSSKQYAKISKDGTVTLKNAGEGKKVKVFATVNYTRNEKKYKKKFTYEVLGQCKVKKLQLSINKNYVFVGKKMKIKAVCKPQKASNKKIKWTSSNKKYATITKKGVICPKAAGAGKTVTFTGKTMDGSNLEKTISVRIIDLSKPMVALTFDDGPSESHTSRIVKCLKNNDARATFFVLGSRINTASAQTLIKSSVLNGNEIASHTYSHKWLPGLSAGQLQWEANETNKRIKAITGMEPELVRPPYGSISSTVSQNIHAPLILWSIDTLDWKSRNASKVIASVMGRVKDGDIILMHDIYQSTADAVDVIVPQLVNRGYQLVTVSELATYKKAKLQDGKTYCNIP